MTIYDQLKRDEGTRLMPYRDTVGKLTIGVGRNLTDRGISGAEADMLLQNDVVSVEAGLKEALPWYADLDPVRQAVLINMAFNLGVAGLLQFHNALGFMQKGLWFDAANELRDSLWAQQVGARAGRLALQLQSGQWV